MVAGDSIDIFLDHSKPFTTKKKSNKIMNDWEMKIEMCNYKGGISGYPEPCIDLVIGFDSINLLKVDLCNIACIWFG